MRVAVFRRVQQIAGEAVRTRPLGNVPGVLVSYGDDDLARLYTARRGFQSPTGPVPVDAGDFGAQPQLDAGLSCVPVEGCGDVVAGREHRRPLGGPAVLG